MLRDNYSQNLALSCGQMQAPAMLHVHAEYIDWLEKTGHLVRDLEHLPDSKAIASRRAAGLGLTRPELALLLAYAKITATQSLVASDLPDEVFAQQALIDYFPSALRERFASTMVQHPLRREIIATQISNELVNLSGSTFLFRVVGETAASVADITRAHTATRRAFRVDELWRTSKRSTMWSRAMCKQGYYSASGNCLIVGRDGSWPIAGRRSTSLRRSTN